MINITVRRAIPDDYKTIGRLLAEQVKMHRNGRPDIFKGSKGKYTYDDFCELLSDPEVVIFTAVCGEAVAGYLICCIIEKKGEPILNDMTSLYLDDLCVGEDYRGTGAGKALMCAAEEHAKSIGCHNVTLNVWEFNENAREFYEHLGYGTQKRQMEKVLT